MRPRLAWLVVLVFAAYGCVTTTPAPRVQPDVLKGVASWYGEEFAGRTTANGEIFDPLLLTAAHRELPFGTIVDVVNPTTSQTVRVRINDRGPYVGNRMIDLSYAAAQQIGLIEPGIGNVEVRIVKVGAGDREPPAPYDVAIQAQSSKPPVDEAPRVAFPLPTQVAKSEPVLAPPPVVAPEPEQVVVVETLPPATTPAATQPATTQESTQESTAASTQQQEAVVDRIIVVEERDGVTTRRQVAADGRTMESVPVDASADVPSSPGHSTAATLDRERASRPAPKPSTKVKQFVVQVGAFSVEDNAKALVGRLERIGQKAWIDRETLYRVRIGPFATRDLAAQTRTALEANGLSGIIVAAD